MRTKKRVDIERLAAALPDYPFAYLVTVDDGYRVHTVTVEPQLREATSTSASSAAAPGRTWPSAAMSPCCGPRPSRAAIR